MQRICPECQTTQTVSKTVNWKYIIIRGVCKCPLKLRIIDRHDNTTIDYGFTAKDRQPDPNP